MKRAFDDGNRRDEELEEGEEEQEEGECSHPVAGPSTFFNSYSSLPPPPPLLKLAIHHSSQNPSANLLPSHQTLALVEGTTTIGRDRSYEPRIRLKTLEVSRTHATIYRQEQEQAQQQQQQQQQHIPDPVMRDYNSDKWFIVDNASTHGTYLRRFGEDHYTRLSEKGQSSLPRQLKHLDTIQIANQRFIVHLHPPEEGISCEACSIKEDRSNLVPLLEDDTKTSNTSSNAQSVVHQQKLAYHSPMDEKTAKTFTKEEKRQNFRSNMQSLRKNLLAGGNTSLSSNSSSSQAPNNIQGKSTSIQRAESVESSYVGNSGGEESNNATSTTSIEAPKYVDRAKLRRSIHPPQHGLSDADPPHHQSKRFRLSSPSSSSANMSMSAQRTEPNYGPGAALFQKMMTNGINSNAQVENTTNLSSDIMANDIQPRYQEVKMGKVIEVKTMADRNAGLGSGTIREGVEQHSNSTDWKDAARQRRWREANR